MNGEENHLHFYSFNPTFHFCSYRKAYGGAYDVMASKHLKGDFNYAWSSAEVLFFFFFFFFFFFSSPWMIFMFLSVRFPLSLPYFLLLLLSSSSSTTTTTSFFFFLFLLLLLLLLLFFLFGINEKSTSFCRFSYAKRYALLYTHDTHTHTDCSDGRQRSGRDHIQREKHRGEDRRIHWEIC